MKVRVISSKEFVRLDPGCTDLYFLRCGNKEDTIRIIEGISKRKPLWSAEDVLLVEDKELSVEDKLKILDDGNLLSKRQTKRALMLLVDDKLDYLRAKFEREEESYTKALLRDVMKLEELNEILVLYRDFMFMTKREVLEKYQHDYSDFKSLKNDLYVRMCVYYSKLCVIYRIFREDLLGLRESDNNLDFDLAREYLKEYNYTAFNMKLSIRGNQSIRFSCMRNLAIRPDDFNGISGGEKVSDAIITILRRGNKK